MYFYIDPLKSHYHKPLDIACVFCGGIFEIGDKDWISLVSFVGVYLKLEIRIEYEHFDPRDKDGIEKKVETSRTFLSESTYILTWIHCNMMYLV